MKQTENLQLDLFTMLAVRDQPIRTALDLFSEISCVVRAALPGDLAEKHMQKIRLAMGDLVGYFGETWEDSIPIEWLLAVCPEKVAKKASSTESSPDLSERAHRVRLVQFHAIAFGFHAPGALEMLLIEAHATELRREALPAPSTSRTDFQRGLR